MFEKMLRSDRIKVCLNTDYRDVGDAVAYDRIIYTGATDEYYDCCFGEFPYRSLRFGPETVDKQFYQPVVQVNYPNEYDFKRIVEIKHVTEQKNKFSTIVREYPLDYRRGLELYCPVPASDALTIYKKYATLAKAEKKTIFAGRLATYRYLSMYQVVDETLGLIGEI